MKEIFIDLLSNHYAKALYNNLYPIGFYVPKRKTCMSIE